MSLFFWTSYWLETKAQCMVKQTGKPTNDPKTVGQGTAKRATEILQAKDPRYRCPTRVERNALRIGFAMRGKTLYGAGYDMVRLDEHVDLTDPDAVS